MVPRKRYPTENLAKALEEVQKGVPVSAAAKKYGVPRTTLLHKKEGKSTLNCFPGPSTILSLEEESVLVKWILALAERHFPVTKTQLLDSVQKIMKESKNKLKSFKNGNRPSDKWFKLFLKRHPEITPRVSQALIPSRETVTENQIRNWFHEIKTYLVSKNIFEITEDPGRVFNTDESAFYLSPKQDKVLVKKGERNVYSASGDEKENLTVLVTANAAGTLAPPMVIFSYVRVPSYISSSIPPEWGVGTSENGWMCAPTFYEYICNVFNPWLEREKIEKPVILFLDGHSSHLTLHLSQYCAANGIELIALFPNSTHLLQPLDVGVFRPLKAAYKREVQKWRIDNLGNKMQKQDFSNVFNKALIQIEKDTIKNAFRGSGICPFNEENVHFNKISKKIIASVIRYKVSANDTITGLEERIDKTKIEQFKACLTGNLNWNGAVEDTSLFEFWKNLKIEKTTGDKQKKSNLEKENDNNIEEAEIRPNYTYELNYPIKIPEQITPKKTKVIGTENQINEKDNEIPSTSQQLKNVPSPLKQLTENVPSPFKKALFWPNPKPVTTGKRKLKEKIPSVITSDAWQTYHIRKENEKKRKLEEKEKRLSLKKEREIEKGKLKKKEITKESETSEEDWQESGSSLDDVDIFSREEEYCDLKDTSNLSVGDYILAKFYGGKRRATVFKYVCVVQNIHNNSDIEVMSMRCVNKDKKTFIFDEDDVSSINIDSILGVLPTPELLGAGERLKYEFPMDVDVFEA